VKNVLVNSRCQRMLSFSDMIFDALVRSHIPIPIMVRYLTMIGSPFVLRYRSTKDE
jgi:hypothetical protein